MAETIDLILAGLDAEITALITDKVDLGTTNPEGKLLIRSGAATLLVEVVLANPAFTTGTGSERNLLGVPLTGTVVATGIAALAQIVDRDENVVFEGSTTVLGGGGLVELDKVEMEIADIVTVQSMVIEYP
jgi:hypothetical protein